MVQNNNLYFYLSKLIIEYFSKGIIKSGNKYQIKFDRREDVEGVFDCLKTYSELFYTKEIKVGRYIFNNYFTYYLCFNESKLIIASHENGDLLTGLRNNFDKAKGFSENSAILFIHNSDLESITKGAESLSSKSMPLHIDTVRRNIIESFSAEQNNKFTKTQKAFLKQLLLIDSADFQIENTSLFDFKKYLNILNKGELKKEDYISLGVFFDNAVHNNDLPNSEIKARIDKNKKWFSEMSRFEQLGSLDGYLQKNFDKVGQVKLKNVTNWPEISFEDLLRYEENRGNIKFNEYIPNTSELTDDNLVIWDKEDGNTRAKKQIRNILIFNPSGNEEINFKIHFKRRPNLSYLKINKVVPNLNESENSIDFIIRIYNPQDFSNTEITYVEEKEGKRNSFIFKVLVVPFHHSLFLGIKSIYKLQREKGNKIGIEFHSNSEIVFNDKCAELLSLAFHPNKAFVLDEDVCLCLTLDQLNLSDNSRFPFTLRYKSASIFAEIILNSLKPITLNGWGVWKKKNITKKSVFYSKRTDEKTKKDIVTLEHGNQIYFPTGEFRENLLLEEKIIESGFASSELSGSGVLLPTDEHLPKKLKELYLLIIKYFNDYNTGKFFLLPSTIYIDENLESIYKEYIRAYIHYLNKIENNDTLNSEHLALLNLGTIQEISSLKRLKYSPLHPLIIAYQLQLREKLDIEDLSSEIIQKFTPLNLIPFINNGNGNKDYFIGVDQDHSPEWLYFVSALIEGQSINRRNVPEMMASKISDFVRHFSFLYIDNDAPIRLNLINMGDGKEALQGIMQYFFNTIKESFKKSHSPNDVFPILLNIYGSSNYVTKFEQLSKFSDVNEIRKIFDIDINLIKNILEPEDFLKLYHEKVQFFIKDIDGLNSNEFDYAHITFHQFDENDIEKSDNDTRNVSTGISLNGILSDLPSIYNQNNYRTGFGIKFLEEDDKSALIEISKKINSIAHIAGTSSVYKENYAFGSVINSNVKTKLNKVYNSSQWVTFINPMVDLSFFKNDEDVVIIHYTDQYGNSSGYDSITITSKWQQYEFIIKEYLESKVENASEHIKDIINMFNAINGYWLLKLGSQNIRETVDKEKISILSAVKEMFAILDHPNVTWVVLSLEEILRVTGAAGLKQSEGLFTVKNLNMSGVFSDDLLMVGLDDSSDDLKLYFYPVEVKIGNNTSSTLSKGVNQGKNTFSLLMKTLNQGGFKGALYRNYFGKLILSAAQKLSLYKIWPQYSSRWDEIESLRGKLLNDNFKIGSLRNYIGDFAIVSFKQNDNFSNRTISLDENILQLNLFQSDGLNDLVKTVDSLRNRYVDSNASGITIQDLLCFKYFPGNSIAVPNDLQDKGDEQSSAKIDLQKKNVFKLEILPVNEHQPLKIIFGYKLSNGKPVEWYPTSTSKVMHTNTGIIGTMGTGKTQFTKALVTQLNQNSFSNVDSKQIGILIFDYKGDYIKDDFITATKAKVYNLHHLPYNPLALSIDNNPKALLPLHTASTLQDTISKAFNLGNKQKATLRDFIMQAYENAGIHKSDKNTWGKVAPTISDVCELYLNQENCSIDSLHAALSELYDYEIFEPKGNNAVPLFELLQGIIVINLSGYSPEIQNLVVAITLDLFYSQMQNLGHSKIDGDYRQINKMVLVDEADNFLSKNFESLRKILKEGREYGVGTILSTQFLNHFITSDNEYSNYILTWIIHRVNEIKDKEVGSLFDIPNKQEREDLITTIKGLEKHQSIVNLAGSPPIKIKDKAFWELLKESFTEA